MTDNYFIPQFSLQDGIDDPSPSWSTVKEQHDRIVIYAGGPSLRSFNYLRLQGLATIIAVNKSAEFLTFADYFMTVDTKDFRRRTRLLNFKGKKYAAVPEDFGTNLSRFRCDRIRPPADVHYLKRIDSDILCTSPEYIAAGGNSGFGAFNLAYHMRPKIVYLFGVDLHEDPSHWYGENHSTRGAMTRGAKAFSSLVGLPFEVVNASPDSAITIFPRMTPDAAVEHLRRNSIPSSG